MTGILMGKNFIDFSLERRNMIDLMTGLAAGHGNHAGRSCFCG